MIFQYYRAIIHGLSDNGQTCVVLFSDYGNAEEIHVADIRAVPKKAWVSRK